MMHNQIRIYADLGAYKTRVTAYTPGADAFAVPIRRRTPERFDDAVHQLIELIDTVRGEQEIARIVLGVRGVLAHTRDRLAHDAVCPEWVGKPVARLITDALGAPVVMENATMLAGLGEAVSGAGKQADRITYHGISSDIDGVRIVSRAPDMHHIGFASGYMRDPEHSCASQDDITDAINALVSGEAVHARYEHPAYELPDNDPFWSEAAEYLAHGIAASAKAHAPDIMVLGGAMVLGRPAIPLTELVQHVHTLLEGADNAPMILPGALGDDAVLHGARAYDAQFA